MTKLPQNLYQPYDVLTRFLESMPDGMAYDILQTKVPALKRLKQKDLDILLQYTREKDRVIVTETKRKGAPASVFLRHKMYGAPTVVPEAEPVKTDTTVYVATAGKPELQPTPPTKAPVTASNRLDNGMKDIQALRERYLDASLHVAAKDILAFLEQKPNGVNRTELGNGVLAYHRLRGPYRQVVLSYLVSHEGVQEVQPEPGIVRGAVRFLHSKFVKSVDKSEKPYDHSAPQLTLDKITPTEEKAPVTPTPTTPVQITDAVEEQPQILSLIDIGQKIVDTLKNTEGNSLTMYKLHNLVPEYHDLSDSERRECVSYLVRNDIVRTYRVPNVGAGTMWIKLYDSEENTHTTGELPNSAIANAVMEALDKQQGRPVDWDNITPVPKIFPRAPMPAPVVFEQLEGPAPEPVGNMSSSSIRAQIAQLEAMAAQLEQKEQNQALRDTVVPLRDAIVKEYGNVQEALTLQIDAVAALGMAIERLNGALK